MASYGVLDWDLTQWQQPTIFNLELMKLAKYYRQQRHLVKMLHKFNDELYSKVIIRKDYEDDNYPPHIFNNPKTDAGGLVFSNGLYSALPEEIEIVLADTSLYSPMYRYYRTANYYTNLMRAVHLRLSLDNKTIWKDWKKQISLERTHYIGKGFIFHDVDITSLPNVLETLTSIEEEYNIEAFYYGFKFPIIIRDEEEFIKWSELKILREFHTFYLATLISDELFAATTNLAKKYEYTLTPELFTNENLVSLFKQGVFLRNRRSSLLLKIEDPTLYNEYDLQLIELLNHYFVFKTQEKEYSTAPLYVLAGWWGNYLKYDMFQLFEYIRKNNYELFRLFYECVDVTLENGIFKEQIRRQF